MNLEPHRNPKSIFAYTDYRSFMLDHYTSSKSKNPLWSYLAWAQRLGLSNNSSLIKVIRGQRHLGPLLCQKLENYFELQGNELAYFRALVGYSKALPHSSQKALWASELKRLHPKKKFEFIDLSVFELISHWYGLAIRQMIQLKDFKYDGHWISKAMRFPVSPKKIEDMVDRLKSLNLVEESDGGRSLTLRNGSLNTSDDIPDEAIKRFHEEMLSRARESLRKVPVNARQISGTTLAISSEDVQEAKQMILEFESEFSKRFKSDTSADEVYQLEIAFFPLTTESQKRGRL